MLASAWGPARVATDVGHGLREGFYMFWATLWALVLGFVLSGAVQAFVPRSAMQRRLGNHGPAAVTRASLYGMASSSCSYAASAMARSLFVKGADFVASMIFMFASTNLVVELGLVLLVLIGWQFLVAEFVGGVIMIALLALTGGLWLRGRALARVDGGHAHTDVDGEDTGWWRARTRAGWTEAAGYTVSDLTMLRRELVIGFGVAGFLAAVVPDRLWTDLFVQGHGWGTSLENVALAPLVAVVSFVCSIGNVPLAAALWKGGISFGGVVSFVFADLITLPMLLVYRKQYGGRMALRMLAGFWLVMSVAGLATQYIFDALGAVPAQRTALATADSIRWNATTYLDIVALIVMAGVNCLYRHRPRSGSGRRYETDPVCRMQVDRSNAPARAEYRGQAVFFCSERCRDRFGREPERYRTDQPVDADGAPVAFIQKASRH